MNEIAINTFLISMSVLYLAMGGGIMYLIIRKIKQDKEDKKGDKK